MAVPYIKSSKYLGFVCFLGAFGVGMGAFGAHGLKSWASPEQLQIWQTATFYLLIHIIPIFLSEFLGFKKVSRTFLAGALVFSLSLYLIVLTQVRRWGAVAPAGGGLLIAGWLLWGMGFFLGWNREGPVNLPGKRETE
jgi:uncharacterized membrane protein YgdD (TMEM256/DUF423 family)